ncbi:hypothetical protein FSARC_8247 [Fusarium sarcochroum]|uniref:DUF7924 domain-containing protein n=1 Tax=Fusarium sarcochroum TaxID=1208366 RepID=A0A8H4TTR6_9HYPO|nr:hypothetical protein FSARC_8247 [Fusarium sarcochroum]
MLPRMDVLVKKNDGSEKRICLLDSSEASLHMPIAVSRFVAEIRKTEGEFPSGYEDEIRIRSLWEHASDALVYEWFMQTEVLDSYDAYAVFDDYNREAAEGFMRDSVGRQGQSVMPATSVTCGYPPDEFGPMSSSGLPSWVVCEAKAFSYGEIFYPFLLINMDGHGDRESGCLQHATDECMVASSFSVDKVNKLNQRLAERSSDGQFQVLNSAVFSIVLNGAVARVFITHAWDENTDHMYTIGSVLLEDPEHNKRFRGLIQSICKWGTTERLQGIINAISAVEKSGPRWYPRYE